MKKITLFLFSILFGSAYGQNQVTVESSTSWNSYVNAFNASDGAYAFGFSYTLSDNRATATSTSVTLAPNIAIWTAEANNTAWFDNSSGTQVPVKTLEVNSYIENNALTSDALTFSGNVTSNDLNSNHTVIAFIKVLDSGYGQLTLKTVALGTGDFSVSATAAETAAGAIIQYGFAMNGPPADPNDAALGSMVVRAPSTASAEDNELISVKMYPNPAKDVVQFSKNSNENLDIQIFDILGKSLIAVKNIQSEVNISTLRTGVYFVQMTLGTKATTKKLIVN